LFGVDRPSLQASLRQIRRVRQWESRGT
jgi:hypothetical protein